MLDRVDVILLMSVNPGFGGQSFIPSTLDKVRQVRALLDAYEQRTGRKILLEIDGGIKVNNIARVYAAGVDVFVAGSAVFGAGSKEGYAMVMSQMRQECSK